MVEKKKAGRYRYSERDANRVTKELRKDMARKEYIYATAKNRALDKADYLHEKATKAYANGNRNKFAKLSDKASKQKSIAERNKIGEKLAKRTIKDLDSGKIKAGRDFVKNTYVRTNIPLDAIGIINVGVRREYSFANKKYEAYDREVMTKNKKK